MRHPSPALVISLIALFVSLGGVGYAATKIRARDIVNGAVTEKKLHRGAVSTTKLKDRAVTGAKVKDGSLTGADVDEATLAQVPSAADALHAASADSAGAVGGLHVRKFNPTGAVPLGSPVTVMELGGLTLRYACSSGIGDTVSFTASTTVSNAQIHLSRTNAVPAVVYEIDADFDVGDSFPLIGFTGTGVYSNPDGAVVTFTYRNPLSCTLGVAGTAYGG